MLIENIYKFLCSPALDVGEKKKQNSKTKQNPLPKHQNNKTPKMFQACDTTFLYFSIWAHELQLSAV